MFHPNFQVSANSSHTLMDTEVSRQDSPTLPIYIQILTSLIKSTRLTSTHYTTQTQDNRLTEAEFVIIGRGGSFSNRNRDETEVKSCFTALNSVDELITQDTRELTIEMIQTMHVCVMNEKAKPTTYRDGQYAIHESESGIIIYLPSKCRKVPQLLPELVNWVNAQLHESELLAPIIAGIAHYLFYLYSPPITTLMVE